MKKLLKYLFPAIIAEIEQEAINSQFGNPEPDWEAIQAQADEEQAYIDAEEQMYEQPSEEQEVAWEASVATEMLQEPINQQFPAKSGDVIHIHSKQGMYSIIMLDINGFTITCNSWLQKYNSGLRKSATETYTWDNYKCHASNVWQRK